MARSGSNYRGPCPLDCKIYVGDLGTSGDRRELEDAFGRYGPLRNVWVARNPPGFAFVEFEDPRDAEDASREMDGRTLCGRRVRVELSNGRSKPKRFGDGRRGDNDRDRDRRGGREDRDGRRGSGRGRERDSRSRSRERDNRRRSRSPVARETKRERSRSGSQEARGRRARGSEEKNGVKTED